MRVARWVSIKTAARLTELCERSVRNLIRARRWLARRLPVKRGARRRLGAWRVAFDSLGWPVEP